MKDITIAVMGGCHVAGYPLRAEKAFPAVLAQLLGGRVVQQVPNLQFVQLPAQLAAVEALQPSHVVLQFGNYEFLASLRQLLHQCSRAFDSQTLAKLSKSTSPGSFSSSETSGAASDSASLNATEVPRTSKLGYYARVATLGLLTSVLWLFSARHRRSFQALNAYVKQHPKTVFIFMSPFPCLEPAANALRQYGGKILRRQLVEQPNFYWFDSHRILRADRRLFVDQLHLNAKAHRVLAHGLVATFLRQSVCLA